MSNQIHITKAIVCGSRHSMTSDKTYLLFTEEIGMLWATARSVRMEKSKQRYALQDFSIIRVSLVQGRSGWRIGSVEPISNPFFESVSREARGGVSFVVKALQKYIHGVTVNPYIFSDTITVIKVLSSEIKKETILLYQQVFLIRLLHELGYVKKTKSLAQILEKNDILYAGTLCTNQNFFEIEKSIAHAQQVSHL